jgi:hypothetical protein
MPRHAPDQLHGRALQRAEIDAGDDVHPVDDNFTLVGVNPALDEFADLARELREARRSRPRARKGTPSGPRSRPS